MAAITSTLAIAGMAAAGGMAAASLLSRKPEQPNMPDPAVERAKAETEAAQKVNSKLAQRNKAMKASSLVADPLGSTGASTALSGGKTSLGQ